MTDHETRDLEIQRLLSHFRWQHLPVHLQNTSKHFDVLARQLLGILPDSPDLAEALRDLRDAKDNAVRATVAMHEKADTKLQQGWSGLRP